MATLSESASWTAGIYQLETTDPVLGGPDGIDNLQAKQLANRTVYLKQHVDALESGTTAAGKATVLATARSLAITGDASWSVSFNGSANVTAALTLANSGVAAGSYAKVTVNAKGLVTAGAALAAADIPTLDWSKITSGKPTTLAGYGITDAQPLDSDLTALAALTTAGFYVNTGVGTVAARSIAVGAGLSVSNGDGVAGNPTLANTGVLSVSGTANQVTVSGSTGNVVFSLPQSIHSGATPSWAQVTLGGDPTAALQAATKQYVDNLVSGLDVKTSVLVATTANITLSGTQTIDGVAVTAGARVLVKNQTTTSQNGIYLCAAGAWTRVTDADTWNELISAFVFVEKGTTNADTGWVCTIDSGGTLGSTAVTFSQFAGAGTVTAGAGISISGNQVALSTSGVTAGTYPKVTVDQYGRVTVGAAMVAADIPNLDWSKITTGKPTTLDGYGITDAQPLDSDLTALAALTTTGFYVNTGVGAVAARSIAVGAGLSVSNGNGVSGNPTITNTGVTSLAGTANQVFASASSGAVTLSLPQAIHAAATPAFAQVSLGADPSTDMQAATKQYVDSQPGRLIGVQIFTSNGTYTPTAGTKSVVVEVQGGGGAGGGSPATTASTVAAGAGGQSGSYAKSRFTSGFSGVAVTVGAGGAAAAAGGAGGNGGTSSFGALVSSPGGNGGDASISRATTYAGITGFYSPNTALPSGGNVVSMRGQAGFFGLAQSGTSLAGAGGSCPLGIGGHSPNAPGSRAGSGYGAGSSGCTNQPSAAAAGSEAGQPGVVIVWEYA